MHMRFCSLLLVILLSSVALHAQQDPFVGSWKQNLAKTKNDPGPQPQNSITIKREAAANGALKTTVDGIDAQGKPTHTEYTAKYDGKDYPVTGSADSDAVAMTRIDLHTRVLINKKAGTVVRILRGTVSPDGKTYTAVSVGIDAQGRAFHNIGVFDKQ